MLTIDSLFGIITSAMLSGLVLMFTAGASRDQLMMDHINEIRTVVAQHETKIETNVVLFNEKFKNVEGALSDT